MGLLIISGVLRVKQFWPEGRSDADTATVNLASARPFVFVNNAGHRAPTRAFANAESVGRGRTPVIKRPKSNPNDPGKVTVRLQGIDAPELHYQPTVKKGQTGVTHEFRQSMGETGADALHAFLKRFGQAEIPCEVLTTVTKPGDVCDVFGRVVGNIVLVLGGARIDINQMLVREGWALPGFYNSMSKQEISALLADHEAAKRDGRGLFSKKIVASDLAPFDPQRRFRKGSPSFKPFSDQGSVNFPKFFRRQADRHVRGALGEDIGANLRTFIAKKPDDLALPREEFLKLSPPTTGHAAKAMFRQLATFLRQNRFPVGPELVYFEGDSKLVKAGTNTEITRF